MDKLTDKERYIMVNACLLPISGMETAEFQEFIDLEHFDDTNNLSKYCEDKAISSLVRKGWIKKSVKASIELHCIPLFLMLFLTSLNQTKISVKPLLVHFLNKLILKSIHSQKNILIFLAMSLIKS